MAVAATYVRDILIGGSGFVNWFGAGGRQGVHDMKTGLSVFPLVSFSVLK